MIVEARPEATTEEELDAIIEEARRRARRRRLGYVAALAGLALVGGGVYLAAGGGGDGGGGLGGGGGGGDTSHAQPSPPAGPSQNPGRPENALRPFRRASRCPGQGKSALPLDFAPGFRAAQVIAHRRVGASPRIDTEITLADAAIGNLCGEAVEDRTLLVRTYDHRFDGASASLAEHRFYVSRFDDGYHAWYWAH